MLEESFSVDIEETEINSEPVENEYQVLIGKLEEKCNVQNKEEQIKTISLLPDTWLKIRICAEFNAPESFNSAHILRLTRGLVKTQRIFSHLCKRSQDK